MGSSGRNFVNFLHVTGCWDLLSNSLFCFDTSKLNSRSKTQHLEPCENASFQSFMKFDAKYLIAHSRYRPTLAF